MKENKNTTNSSQSSTSKKNSKVLNMKNYTQGKDDSYVLKCVLKDFNFGEGENPNLESFESDIELISGDYFPIEHEKNILSLFIPMLVEKLKGSNLVYDELISELKMPEDVEYQEEKDDLENRDKSFTKEVNTLLLNTLGDILDVEEFEELADFIETKEDRVNMLHDVLEYYIRG